jgi:hypothetical protein
MTAIESPPEILGSRRCLKRETAWTEVLKEQARQQAAHRAASPPFIDNFRHNFKVGRF